MMQIRPLAPVARRLVPGFLKPALRPLARRLVGPLQVTPTGSSQAEDVTLPQDVSDEAEMRRYLAANSAIFGDPREGEGYLNYALRRFQITMALVPPVSEAPRVLELGANPYFLTRLLQRRGFQVTCANWFNEEWGRKKHRQAIPGPDGGELAFEFDHFNIETDRFPYEDGSFDLVLFCEILEHLPCDPVHALAEIHRVLDNRTGTLLLTTPNPARAENLGRLQRGENVYEQLSGYGAYGRHNREYTVGELRLLLEELGYRVERLVDLDLHAEVDHAVDWSGADVRHRRENLFCVARPSGEARWRYPAWLYQSTHSLYGTRIVRPDLAAGLNDTLQSSGLHDLEEVGGQPVRWTGETPARVMLEPGFSGAGRIEVEAIAPPAEAAEAVGLTARTGESEASWEIPADGRPVSLSASFRASAGRTEVVLTTDRTWTAADAGPGTRAPHLGVGIRSVAIVPE